MFSKDIPSQLSLQSLLRLALHSQLRKGKVREWMAGVYGDTLASPLFSIGLLRGVEIHRGSLENEATEELHIPSNPSNCALKNSGWLTGSQVFDVVVAELPGI
jgi:hypothetical protein